MILLWGYPNTAKSVITASLTDALDFLTDMAENVSLLKEAGIHPLLHDHISPPALLAALEKGGCVVLVMDEGSSLLVQCDSRTADKSTYNMRDLVKCACSAAPLRRANGIQGMSVHPYLSACKYLSPVKPSFLLRCSCSSSHREVHSGPVPAPQRSPEPSALLLLSVCGFVRFGSQPFSRKPRSCT